jgi:hypothetical protein
MPTQPPVLVLQQPSAPTLKKYGLSLDDWQALASKQGRVCAVCKKLPKSGRLCIDHFHVPKWKHLAPEVRKTFVRGLCCYQCNHALLRRGMTPERLRAAATYQEVFQSSEA